MATFREITYMVLDLLKERSDDSFFTEEHVIFLASKMRALLLERKLRGSRNASFQETSRENMQQICIALEPAEMLPFGCSGLWLKSTKQIPQMINSSPTSISTVNDLMHSTVTYIPPERMPYVGYNKWLKNIIYASRSADGYLYLNSTNPQFRYLESVKLQGVFSNPEEAAALACNDDGSSVACDVMDQEFPLEDSLIPSCIELVVQELTGARYSPEDKINNAKDDLAEIGLVQRRAATPAETMMNSRQMMQNSGNETGV